MPAELPTSTDEPSHGLGLTPTPTGACKREGDPLMPSPGPASASSGTTRDNSKSNFFKTASISSSEGRKHNSRAVARIICIEQKNNRGRFECQRLAGIHRHSTVSIDYRRAHHKRVGIAAEIAEYQRSAPGPCRHLHLRRGNKRNKHTNKTPKHQRG